MPTFQKTLHIATGAAIEVIDITGQVERAVAESGAASGQCLVYVAHATAAICINENADPNIGVDLATALDRMVPLRAGWLHDQLDGNAAAHIKAAVVGPSETIPVAGSHLCLGTWQNVFLCEFDGPRAERKVIVSVVW